MIACNARHPQNPDVVCVEWSHHRERHHLGFRPDASHIGQNEVRWPVAEALTMRPACRRCQYRVGHKDFCELRTKLGDPEGYWTFDALEEAEL